MRALNITSMLLSYQAELFDDMAREPDTSMRDDATTVVDICPRVQHYTVQAAEKFVAMLVLHKRWLNLTNLSEKEGNDILDILVVLEGIFGSALDSTQNRCQAKKKEEEALQLRLPRKAPAMA